MKELDIDDIISKMTLEQKANLCSGTDTWHTAAYQELGLPDIMVSDGPHGLRKEGEPNELGIRETIKAICFPTVSCSMQQEMP